MARVLSAAVNGGRPHLPVLILVHKRFIRRWVCLIVRRNCVEERHHGCVRVDGFVITDRLVERLVFRIIAVRV